MSPCYWSANINFKIAAIDLVDEAAAKLKMEITSKPTALDEINRSVLKLEMERLSLTNDTDKASRDRLNRLEAELSLLKDRQAQLTEQWEHEKSVMTRLQSIKEEVSILLLHCLLTFIYLSLNMEHWMSKFFFFQNLKLDMFFPMSN